jgi:hypothetical protein
MSSDEIGQTILNALTPEARSIWRLEVGVAQAMVELIFRSNTPLVLNINAVARCFSPFPDMSWQVSVGDESDTNCIVFQGGIGGKHVQARFCFDRSV